MPMPYRVPGISFRRRICRLFGLLLLFSTITFLSFGIKNVYEGIVTKTGDLSVPAGQWWPSHITVKGPRAPWHWSVSRRGTVFKLVNSHWTEMSSLCKSEEKTVKHVFLSPGGTVTAFFSSIANVVRFDHVHKRDMIPTILLMTRDATLTYVDIGANDGTFSLVMAALGSQVLAVEPNVKNVRNICRGIHASSLSGRCYVVANAIGDRSNETVMVKPGRGKSTAKYWISKKMEGRGIETTTIILSDLLKQFPLGNVGIRFGVHHNVSAILHGDDAFFKSVNVQFISMNWYYVQSQGYHEQVLGFMSDNGYTGFGYWTKFVSLGDNISTWPENVIFRRSLNSTKAFFEQRIAKHNRDRTTSLDIIYHEYMESMEQIIFERYGVKLSELMNPDSTFNGPLNPAVVTRGSDGELNAKGVNPGQKRIGVGGRGAPSHVRRHHSTLNNNLSPGVKMTSDKTTTSMSRTSGHETTGRPRSRKQVRGLPTSVGFSFPSFRSDKNVRSRHRNIRKPGNFRRRTPNAHARPDAAAQNDNTRRHSSIASSGRTPDAHAHVRPDVAAQNNNALKHSSIASSGLKKQTAVANEHHNIHRSPSGETVHHVERGVRNKKRLEFRKNQMLPSNGRGAKHVLRTSARTVDQAGNEPQVAPQRMRSVPKDVPANVERTLSDANRPTVKQ